MSDFTATQLAVEMTSTQEKIIKEAINFKIGTDWDMFDVIADCSMKTLPDKTQIFCFQGEDLIHFNRIKYDLIEGVNTYKMTASQDYRLLYNPEKPL